MRKTRKNIVLCSFFQVFTIATNRSIVAIIVKSPWGTNRLSREIDFSSMAMNGIQLSCSGEVLTWHQWRTLANVEDQPVDTKLTGNREYLWPQDLLLSNGLSTLCCSHSSQKMSTSALARNWGRGSKRCGWIRYAWIRYWYDDIAELSTSQAPPSSAACASLNKVTSAQLSKLLSIRSN